MAEFDSFNEFCNNLTPHSILTPLASSMENQSELRSVGTVIPESTCFGAESVAATDANMPSFAQSAQGNATVDTTPLVEPAQGSSSTDKTLQHSSTAQSYLGQFVPTNTRKASRNALVIFSKFVLRKDRFLPTAFEFGTSEEAINKILEDARCVVFKDGFGSYIDPCQEEWEDDQLRVVRFWMIEFVVNYRSDKTTEEVSPGTMKGYVASLQRAFNSQWGYEIELFKNPIFTDKDNGLIPVMDNRFREQQNNGSFVKSHNVLTLHDIEKLYKSRSLSRRTPLGFVTRMVFNIALVTAMRPSSLWNLKMKQFNKQTVDGEEAWVITGVMGSMDGASKTEKGGLKSAHEKPLEIVVWRQVVFDGELCVFDDINDYMEMRQKRNIGTERFFLQANRRATDHHQRTDFIKAQHIGKNSFMEIVKSACVAEGISGSGAHKFVTMHGLRATVASMLCRSGHPGSSVAMRTGHRAVEQSLRSYQNLRSAEGRQQQANIFGCNDAFQRNKRVKGDSTVGGSPSTADFSGRKDMLAEVQNEIGASNCTLDGVGGEIIAADKLAAAQRTATLPQGYLAEEHGVLGRVQGLLGSVGNLTHSAINISINLGDSSGHGAVQADCEKVEAKGEDNLDKADKESAKENDEGVH